MSQDGDITVMWSYVHTGGLPLTGVSVMYSYVEGTSTNTEAVSSVGISDLMVTVPDLVAGEQYTFTVTAENSNGSSSTVCEPVDHIIGECKRYMNANYFSLSLSLSFSLSFSLSLFLSQILLFSSSHAHKVYLLLLSLET